MVRVRQQCEKLQKKGVKSQYSYFHYSRVSFINQKAQSPLQALILGRPSGDIPKGLSEPAHRIIVSVS